MLFRLLTRFSMALAMSVYAFWALLHLVCSGEAHLAIWWANLVVSTTLAASLWDCVDQYDFGRESNP